MNTKEYIRSGIVESYVLGIATDAEKQEFESMCSLHPEIAEARDVFEKLLEEKLLHDAKQPPAFLKQKIQEAINTTVTDNVVEEQEEHETTPVKQMGIWKWLAAASLILVAAAGYWAYTTNNKYTELQAEYNDLQQQVKQSANQLNEMKEEADMLQSPSVKMASLQSMPAAPGANGKVFWDSTSKDVYLAVNNLPQPASDKQYQLWALINDQPVDLGVLEVKQKRLLVKMKGVREAHAFAITLEPKGGSSKPTGDMYVMGKL